MTPQVEIIDKGLIDYKECWDFQEDLFKETVDQKILLRDGKSDQQTNDYLIFCQHPHVYTLGKSGNEQNLLMAEAMLKSINAQYYKINRGGDITYHGPGQIVMYPIFDLDHFFTDIHKYMRFLEEAVILTLAEFGIKAGRVEGLTGVWLDGGTPKERKICAMGVKASRWVTMHGIALNVNTDLSYFNHIVPCGIEDKSVTSMEKELGKRLDLTQVQEVLKENMANIFNFDYKNA
ncbi:lipoyl(octanoyl) transferase LipB [Paracrocinitomix mangrovi]|uniref:lipoyl(octanoyl) transferase LipB n=1 Tax=Paracrocinitomix mangrovi TaxID=2862509 RepID=UPI001C8D994A|nr:lipoyl(octanoyl) transferase LipB [Paracrocinitomix mangrovi]UKN00589.1 lipoyl(octanoyl) transferase LipB [Paracrocinitomix mangrovi]